MEVVIGMVQRLVKTIMCEKGDLYSTANGRCILLARCRPRIEITEQSVNIKSIGVHGFNVKKNYITLILCGTPELTRELDMDFWNTVTSFGIEADIQRTDGVFERMYFDNAVPQEIDLDGEWVFEVTGQPGFTKKLLSI